MLIYEGILFAVLLFLAMALAGRIDGIRRRIVESVGIRLQRPMTGPLINGSLAAAGTALVLFAGPGLEPAVHDEFAYLLGAETFAAGRLTNPGPELVAPFETFHELMRPTYQSKFPPGQSLWLALGLRVGSLEAALIALAFCFGTSITWALAGLTGKAPAFLGGLLAALRFGGGTYWTHSLWGGALPGIAGALVFGAAMRLLRDDAPRKPALSLTLGLGLAGLALTRPYEGAAFALVPAVAVTLRWWRTRRVASLGLAVLPLAGALVFLGVYHEAVTGDPFRFPYAAHEATYTRTPPFLFLPAKDETVGDAARSPDMLRRFYEGWLPAEHQAQRGGPDAVAAWGRKLATQYEFFLGVFGAVLVAFALTGRRREDRLGRLAFLLMLGASLAVAYALPHYLAPGVVIVALLYLRGLERLGRFGAPGRALATGIVVAFLLIFAARIARRISAEPGWAHERQRVIADLAATPEPDLVFVRYGPDHSMHHEWVFNPPRHADAPVLFARTRGGPILPAWRAAFPGRRHWELRVNGVGDPVELRPLE